jgi:hypothetical protein
MLCNSLSFINPIDLVLLKSSLICHPPFTYMACCCNISISLFVIWGHGGWPQNIAAIIIYTRVELEGIWWSLCTLTSNNQSSNVIVSFISLNLTMRLFQAIEKILGYKWSNCIQLEIIIPQEVKFFFSQSPTTNHKLSLSTFTNNILV